jgi:ABC-type spermidine/putrescine transport system permease subunit II
MFMYSRLHRTVDPSINVVSTMLLAITLVLWVIAFAFAVRAARSGRTRAADALLGEAAA